MQLTSYTDYALRVLLYLCPRRERLVTISEMAAFHQISRNHLMKVVSHLVSLGYVKTVRGKNGGVRLAREPGQIRLGEVITAIEPNLDIVECFNAKKNTCVIASGCKLRAVLHQSVNAWLENLNHTTLADLC